MKKTFLSAICVCAAVLLTACGGPLALLQTETTPAPVLDLSGYWVQTNSPSDSDYQAIYIQDKYMEIYWIVDGSSISTEEDRDNGTHAALYWAGTYQAPTSMPEQYSWTSMADKARTTDSLLTTSEDTKKFRYIDGQLCYTVTVDGKETNIYADREEWDYEFARRNDNTEINYYDFIDMQYALIKDLNIKEIVMRAVNERINDIQQTVENEITSSVDTFNLN